jgi:hypothetical protein
MDDARLQELTNTLANFKAGPSGAINFEDLKDPHWKEKLIAEGLPHLYQQYGEMYPVIQELCGLYASASAEQQAWVRQTIGHSKDALNALNQYTPSLATGEHLTYQEWKAGYATLKAQNFDHWLRLLITALALKLTRLDYRDDILAIQHLASDVQKRGLDFEPYRQELIRLSDSQSAAQVGLRRKDS